MLPAERPTASPAPLPGISELVARTDADLLVVHDGGPVRVESVVLHEPEGQLRLSPGAVVLAVGYPAGSPAFDQLVAIAAETNAVAVVAKPSSIARDALRLLGEQHGITTIVAGQSTDWLSLASMLRSAAAVSSVDAIAGVKVGDLFAFANAIALATGGATAIVDPAGRVLGFSNLADQPLDELRRRTTLLLAEQDSPSEDPDYRRLYASTTLIQIPAGPETFERIAIAVRSDREILGSIWVLVAPGRDRHHAERALLQYVEAAAVHLHHARAELDVQRTRYSQLLQAILRGDEGAASSAATLGIQDRSWFRLAILVPDAARGPSLSRHQVNSVSNWLSIVHDNALVTEVRSQLVVLFSGRDPDEWPHIERGLATFLRSADAMRGAVTAATSLAVARTRDLAGEFGLLRTLAHLAADSKPGPPDRSPVFRMEDHWSQVELATIAEMYAAGEPQRLAVLEGIREYDQEHGTAYWDTLRAYVLGDRSFIDAAARLTLHPNSVRYRIGRLRHTFDLDLDNPATFLWVAVQIHHPSA